MRPRLVLKLKCVIACYVAVAAICTTGCQIDVGGQTLPSPYYLTDDIQYFPAGPEFQLTNEARAMELYAEDVAAEALESPEF